MKIYARIEGGKVAEIIEPFADADGNEVAIEKRFHPDIVATLVDITGTDVAPGWAYAGGAFAAPAVQVLSADEIKAQKLHAAEATIQQHLDNGAKTKRYDDIRSAALRAGYPGPFHDEGVAFATWMDACWAKAYEILGEVETGTRVEPTAAELIAEMPALVLP